MLLDFAVGLWKDRSIIFSSWVGLFGSWVCFTIAGICGGGDGIGWADTLAISPSWPSRGHRTFNRAEEAAHSCSRVSCQSIHNIHGWANIRSWCSSCCHCDENCSKHSWHWPDCSLHHSSTQYRYLWVFWWGKEEWRIPIVTLQKEKMF